MKIRKILYEEFNLMKKTREREREREKQWRVVTSPSLRDLLLEGLL